MTQEYSTDNDRRRYRRYGIKDSSLKYTTGGKIMAMFQPPSKKYLVLNISEDGLHFISKNELQIGSKITMSITAPLVDSEIKTSGKVIWCLKSEEHDAFRVGVQWVGLGKTNQLKLKHLLNNAIMDKVDVTTSIYFRESEKL